MFNHFNQITFVTLTLLISSLIMFSLFSKSTEVDINSDDFKKMLDKDRGVIIDVRTKNEYDQGHLKLTDAQYDFFNGDFQKQIDSLDKDQTYYLYCRSGNRSGQDARLMQKEGFKNVYNIGGFEDLAGAGFETNK